MALFCFLFTLINQSAQAAHAKSVVIAHVCTENYVQEFFDLKVKPQRAFHHIVPKVLVTLLIAFAFVLGLGFFFFLISLAFGSLIGSRIGSILTVILFIYLFYVVTKRFLRKQYKRIDARWKRET
jgi:uncharacterized membrane protein